MAGTQERQVPIDQDEGNLEARFQGFVIKIDSSLNPSSQFWFDPDTEKRSTRNTEIETNLSEALSLVNNKYYSRALDEKTPGQLTQITKIKYGVLFQCVKRYLNSNPLYPSQNIIKNGATAANRAARMCLNLDDLDEADEYIKGALEWDLTDFDRLRLINNGVTIAYTKASKEANDPKTAGYLKSQGFIKLPSVIALIENHNGLFPEDQRTLKTLKIDVSTNLANLNNLVMEIRGQRSFNDIKYVERMCQQAIELAKSLDKDVGDEKVARAEIALGWLWINEIREHISFRARFRDAFEEGETVKEDLHIFRAAINANPDLGRNEAIKALLLKTTKHFNILTKQCVNKDGLKRFVAELYYRRAQVKLLLVDIVDEFNPQNKSRIGQQYLEEAKILLDEAEKHSSPPDIKHGILNLRDTIANVEETGAYPALNVIRKVV